MHKDFSFSISLPTLVIFWERRGGRKKWRETSMCERYIDQLPLVPPQLGTWPATQACALTGNWTGDLLVLRPVLNPLSYTSQGSKYPLFIFIFWYAVIFKKAIKLITFSTMAFYFIELRDLFLNTGQITSWDRQICKVNVNENIFFAIIKFLLAKRTILESASSQMTYSVFHILKL